MPDPTPKKKLVALIDPNPPGKSLKDLSPAELDAWTDETYKKIQLALKSVHDAGRHTDRTGGSTDGAAK